MVGQRHGSRVAFATTEDESRCAPQTMTCCGGKGEGCNRWRGRRKAASGGRSSIADNKNASPVAEDRVDSDKEHKCGEPRVVLLLMLPL